MWWTLKNGVKSGPFTRDKIETRLRLGMLGPLDRLSEDGGAWQYVRETEFWKQERTIPESVAMSTPGAASKAKISLAERRMNRAQARRPTATLSPAPVESELPSPADAPNPVSEKHRRMNRPVVITISVLGTLVAVFVVLFVIGIVSSDAPSSGTGTASQAGAAGDYVDDGFRGAELTTLNLSAFDPKYHDFLLYITPSYNELKQMFSTVENSEHVSRNELYSFFIQQVRLYHDPSADDINAFATPDDVFRKEIDPRYNDESTPAIVLMGGAGRFARIVGAAIAEKAFDDLDELLARIGKYGKINNDLALQLLSNELNIPLERFSDEAWLATAKEISRGLLLGIMAHEAGHVALGHVLSWKSNNERTRNQEREADSFAHSVASGTADADNMFYGNLFFHFAFAIHEGGNANSAASRTHPYSEERLFNLIRDNSSTAAKLGITEDDVREWLKEARSIR